jgi:hypothetical protein
MSGPCTLEQQIVYQQLIGIVLWIVMCGRYDIAFPLNTLSAFSAAPREGHLESVAPHRLLKKDPVRWIKIDSSKPGGVPDKEPCPFETLRHLSQREKRSRQCSNGSYSNFIEHYGP